MDIQYINWNKEQKTWNPETARHYVLNTSNERIFNPEGAFFGFQATHFEDCSLESTRKGIRDLMAKYPTHDWAGAGLQIVKAPCAFDAKENHVFVEEVR